ncbi:MAG TPA: UDP-N-acetylmuramate--L-alanine ligase [Patescibacteria group bacterium]
MNILEHHHFHLVGIKGVAMTALAQCLIDAGKTVTGSDVAEKFVTQEILDRLPVEIHTGFTNTLPAGTECVIYTSAHNAQDNPQVQAALSQNIPTLSHAEALASLFNQKHGIAVCGVGGKSTTSAMITWILEKAGLKSSFTIGVGNVPGLEKTGQWSEESKYFVAEADEYVTDPAGARRGENFVPRFAYLKPFITVCTNLKFDHPDVYRDFEHTKEVYREFFNQIKPNGYLIVNGDDVELWTLAKEVGKKRSDIHVIRYGEAAHCDIQLRGYTSDNGVAIGNVFIADPFRIELNLPGKFNMLNAVAALGVIYTLTHLEKEPIALDKSIQSLTSFRSTKRRSEFIGEKNGVKYYDDYAHHPSEVASIIKAFQEWFPHQRVVVSFQSHTFSRTKELFSEFVDALGQAQEIVMVDIFASAREAYDSSVSSDSLCLAIKDKYPAVTCQNLKTIDTLADWCHHTLKPGDIFLTVGAGDIYKVHDLI